MKFSQLTLITYSHVHPKSVFQSWFPGARQLRLLLIPDRDDFSENDIESFIGLELEKGNATAIFFPNRHYFNILAFLNQELGYAVSKELTEESGEAHYWRDILMQLLIAREEIDSSTQEMGLHLYRLEREAEATFDFSISYQRLRRKKGRLSFTTAHPERIQPYTKYSLRTFIHYPESWEAVEHLVRRMPIGIGTKATASGEMAVMPGVRISVVPYLRNCDFTPISIEMEWRSRLEYADFTFLYNQRLPKDPSERVLEGSVQYRYGPLIIGETPFHVWLKGKGEFAQRYITSSESAPVRVFMSYSRKDEKIVSFFEEYLRSLGSIEPLRDVKFLRSGDDWDIQIMRKIEDADSFSLFWSENARASRNVRREWKYALSLRRPGFIRPVYWAKTLPALPPELKDIHFQKIPRSPEFGG